MNDSTPKKPKTAVKPLRLTRDMRSAFVAAVMADVPEIDYEERIRAAVNKAHAAALPEPIKKLLQDIALAPFVKVEHVTINRNDGLPFGACVSFSMPAPSHEWLDEVAVAAAEPHIKGWQEQEQRQRELRNKLQAVADVCSTTTKLAEAFPEFARYLPQTEAEGTRNLPALANVVAEFTKAGWPNGRIAE